MFGGGAMALRYGDILRANIKKIENVQWKPDGPFVTVDDPEISRHQLLRPDNHDVPGHQLGG